MNEALNNAKKNGHSLSMLPSVRNNVRIEGNSTASAGPNGASTSLFRLIDNDYEAKLRKLAQRLSLALETQKDT